MEPSSSAVSQPLPVPLVAPSPGARARPEEERGYLRRLPLLVLLWAIAGLLSSLQVYFIYRTRDPNVPFPFTKALILQLAPWTYWGFVTPLILALGRRWRFERSTWTRSLALHLPSALAVSIPHALLVYASSVLAGEKYFLDRPWLESWAFIVGKSFLQEAIIYGGILAVGYALEYHRRFREGELAQARLESQLVHAQLDALRAQLHPHFLFNTLNAISVLVRKQDTSGSIRMLTGVSELLRIALHHTGRQLVPLCEDLDFLERYLDIEQTRFQDRLRVSRAIEPDVLDALVPNLLLQPLVENAVKHGVAPRSGAGHVELRASRRGARLVLEVLDDGPGLAPGWDGGGDRIGLANVTARLRQLYGADHAFLLENRPEGGVRARLELPFRAATEAAA